MFKKNKYFSISVNKENKNRANKIPGQINCPACSSQISELELFSNYKVCPECNYHFSLTAHERIDLIVDSGSFEEFDQDLYSYNILNFPDYDDKILQAEHKSGLKEAVITGQASIDKYKILLAVMDSRFMMASMGSVVGEKICRLIEKASVMNLPLIICSSSGGARMQEGMISLMQMAKTSAALARFNKQGLLYISLLTHPTTGGVSASFASLADIIISEPGALIGFAGPRVIEKTIGQKLPERFQHAEFLLDHGMIDLLVNRSELKNNLASLLKYHQGGHHG